MFRILCFLFSIAILSLVSCKKEAIKSRIDKQQNKEIRAGGVYLFAEKIPQFSKEKLDSVYFDIIVQKGLDFPSTLFLNSNKDNKYVWLNNDSLHIEELSDLIDILNESEFQGVPIGTYPINRIADLMTGLVKGQDTIPDSIYSHLAEIEFLANKSSSHFATGMDYGFLNPKKIIGNYYAIEQEMPDSLYFEDLKEKLKNLPIEFLNDKLPTDSAYKKISSELEFWITMPDSISEIFLTEQKLPQNKELKKGETFSELQNLSKKLFILGFLNNDTISSVSEDFLEGLNKFREQNYLYPKDVLDVATVNFLNQTPENYKDKLSVNLERLRWKTEKPEGEIILFANIASQRLFGKSFKDGRELEMNVAVGKTYTKTPLFVDEVEYIDLKPEWVIPQSIIRGEILRKQQNNENYIKNQRMVIYKNGHEVSPESIDWNEYTPSNFNYDIRQMPGISNSLGQVKFIFPNSYSVYMHDTPVKSVFLKDNRAVSHGCVRLQQPYELAEFLFFPDKALVNNIYYSVGQKVPFDIDEKPRNMKGIIKMRQKVGVILDYYTAVVDKDNNIKYAKDIYGYDKLLNEHLKDLNINKHKY